MACGVDRLVGEQPVAFDGVGQLASGDRDVVAMGEGSRVDGVGLVVRGGVGVDANLVESAEIGRNARDRTAECRRQRA